jgi:hypothetical protein
MGLAAASLAAVCAAILSTASACSLTYAIEARLIGTGPVRFHCGVLRVDAHDQAEAVQTCRNHIGDETRSMGRGSNPQEYWNAVNDCACTPARPDGTTAAAPTTTTTTTTSGSELPATWTDEQIAAALAPVRPGLTLCAGSVASFDLHMLFTVSGHVEGASSAALSDTQVTCVRDALSHVQLPGRVRGSREVTLRFEHAPPTP